MGAEKDMGLRVLYIAMDVNFPDYYGGAKRAYETARIFQKKGHEVSILVFRKSNQANYEIYEGIHIYRADIFDLGVFIRKFVKGRGSSNENKIPKAMYADYFHPRPLIGIKEKLIDLYRHRIPLHKYIRNLMAWKMIWRIVKERKIDIIIERGPSYGVGAIISKLTDRLYVVDFIDILYSNQSLKLADLVLSYFSTIQIPCFVDRKKIIKVYTAADENKFKPMAKDFNFLNKIGISSDDFVLIYSGGMYYWHGLDTIVESMKILFEQGHRDIKLILLGDGEARDEIESLVKKYQLQSVVLFTGKVPFDEVPKYLASADVALSLNTGDSIGFKLIEYMASGKAIITTNVDFVHTIAENNVDLFFVPINNPQALSGLILKLKNNLSLKHQFEENVRKKFLKNLTWGAHYNNITQGLINFIKEKRKSV
mgnify:CR=1 FL=1